MKLATRSNALGDRIATVVAFSFLAALVNQPRAQEQSQTMDLIIRTADAICGKVDLIGNSRSAEVNGAAGVEVSKLVKQLVDLKVSGAAKWIDTKYQGLLQADLPEALKSQITCKTKVLELLVDKLVVKAEPPKVPTTNGCQFSGYLFDQQTHAPIVGAFVDAYTFEPLTNIKASRYVKQVTVSGPGGKFSGDCRGIAQSNFPLRFGVRRTSGGATNLTPGTIDFNDVKTDVNLPVLPE